MPYADLEISLRPDGPGPRPDDTDTAWLALRFTSSDSQAEAGFGLDREVKVEFDNKQLRELSGKPDEYGRALTRMLFADIRIKDFFRRARKQAEALSAAANEPTPLRVKLAMTRTVRLHGKRWECLRDPETDQALGTSQAVIVSRFLESADTRQVRPLGAFQDLTAVLAVAGGDPGARKLIVNGLELAKIDVPAEEARARLGLAGSKTVPLTAPGSCTIGKLGDALRAGCDIFYLVCHGAIRQGKDRDRDEDFAWLFLEDDAGNLKAVLADELIKEFEGLLQVPRLVVLVSCQSAGGRNDGRTNDKGALAALGPRLAEIGVPAVVAMQDDITMASVEAFIPAFFKTLRRTGSIDAALSDGRNAIRTNHDFWKPVLFTRLRAGRLSPLPDDFEKWETMLTHLEKGNIVPVLGPELLDPYAGSMRDRARRWARRFGCPAGAANHEDFTSVAQYLAVNHDRGFVRARLVQDICEEAERRAGRSPRPDDPNDQLLHAASERRKDPAAYSPHEILAALPCEFYITSTPDRLLVEALRPAKQPQVFYFDRSPENPVEQPRVVADEEDFGRPPANRPIVYQLFGRFKPETSLVLTEDDHLDFLLASRAFRERIPTMVRQALGSLGLLFLGFRLDELGLRVLLRFITDLSKSDLRSDYTSVLVQVDPDDPSIEEPELAKRYLERRLRVANIEAFWGSAETFLVELKRRWDDRKSAKKVGP